MLINIHTHHRRNSSHEIINSSTILNDSYFSFGIMHNQHDLLDFDSTKVESIYQHKNCIAIGEIGLDKNGSIDINKQIQLFKNQIVDSEKHMLPVLLHCVKSWNEIFQIRKEITPKQPWIFHGFRKTTLTKSVLDSGVFISIGTALLWDSKLQETAKNIPLKQLFLETDDDTVHTIDKIYEKMAQIKNISLQELEEQLYINTKNTFKKWEIG
jgi:TatD DNase family protein